MSRGKLIAGLCVLAFTAAPAVAQQGTVKPRHVTHPAPAHKMPAKASMHPDQSADDLNAKELASIQHGSTAPTPAPAKTP